MTILEHKIKQKIKEKGFIWVDEFFEIAMFDNENGYYIIQNPIGKDADFITAPEISQIFGEIIACFLHYQFTQNKIGDYQLLEIGAGKGTLLKDVLFTLEKLSASPKKAYIMDINKSLISIQKETLKNYDVAWIKNFSELGGKPTFILANELFDALPTKQFVVKNCYFHERGIKLNSSNEFEFFVSEKITELENAELLLKGSKEGQIVEISGQTIAFMQQISDLINNNKGLVAIFDYGYWDRVGIDTLQSIHRHKINNIFNNIGLADLTYLVDFKTLYATAKQKNIQDIFFQTQSEFLLSMGIMERLGNLRNHLSSRQYDAMKKSVERLISKNQMGEAFKCLILEKFS